MWLWNPSYTSSPGRLIKIVFNTRVFSAETIEGWEIYRQEYWDRVIERMKRLPMRANATNIIISNNNINNGTNTPLRHKLSNLNKPRKKALSRPK
jgi:hypothetical protein